MLKVILPLCLGCVVWLASNVHAVQQCIPEPTDMAIEFGDTFTCEIEAMGDTDVFHFFGQVGDTVVISVASMTRFLDTCITLTAPNGETTDGCSENRMIRIDAVLNQGGTYTITVREFDNDFQGTYEIALACLGGPCTVPVGNPEIAVSPPNADFGPVGLTSESAPFMFLIKHDIEAVNDLGPRLRIEPITLEGSNAEDFAIRNDECSNRSIPPGLRCTVEVVFSPGLLGTKTASLLIPSNATPEQPLEIMLSGVGQGASADPIGGSVSGVSPVHVVCTNLTTSQSILIPNSPRIWDCEAAGLTANPGDDIFQAVTGTAD